VCGVVVVLASAAPANRRVGAKPERAGPRGLKARTGRRRRRRRSVAAVVEPDRAAIGRGPLRVGPATPSIVGAGSRVRAAHGSSANPATKVPSRTHRHTS